MIVLAHPLMGKYGWDGIGGHQYPHQGPGIGVIQDFIAS